MGSENSKLWKAVDKGDVGLARRAVDKGADINQRSGDWTPLMKSVINGHPDVVKLLLNRGADINIKDRLGVSPLQWAIEEGHMDIARKLLDRGADINIKDRRGVSPLQWAIERGHMDIAKELLDRGADINIKDWRGASPLHWAIERGHMDIAKELLDRGVDINIKAWWGDSPLQLAIKGGHMAIARGLLDRGADINIEDGWGASPLQCAIERGHMDIAWELLDRGADINIKDGRGVSPLERAIEGGHMDIARELLDRGADINIKDGRGASPLQWAIERGHMDIARELLDRGADINIKDRWGASPLQCAIEGGHMDIARELLDRGADINIKDEWGVRPLQSAIERGRLDIAKELLDRGADINARELSVRGAGIGSALHLSLIEGNMNNLQVLRLLETRITSELCSEGLLHTPVRLGYDNITRFLLSLEGIDVNATDSLGQFPLHFAMEIGNEDIISELLDAGCKLDALDDSGRTVLHLSASYGHCELTGSFIKRGLDPNQADFQGKTCVHYGVLYRNDEAVRHLCHLGAECTVEDHAGKVPVDYLHPCERNSAIFKELTKEPLRTKVLPPLKESIQEISPSCYNLSQIGKQPGIGSVNTIKGFVMADFIKLVKEMVENVIHDALPNAGVNVVGCGSSFEGSKVGMPDELDFLIEIFSIYRYPGKDTEGYGKMERDEVSIKKLNIQGTYGVWLWDKLMTYWKTNQNGGIGCGFRLALPPQRHPDRKTCTTWIWLYSNDMFKELPVSIDFVPAIKTDCLYEKRTTWMMTKTEIQKKHRHIVPKIPYESSDVCKFFKPEDLNQLGRTSYPTLEVEHMQSLDERLMDVFITAKALRRPEVCGFKIRNENGKAVAVGEHITSYRLKTVFLHLVELFLKSDTLSLGRMLVLVYEHLEKCLKRGRLPSYFDPKINVLAGCRLNTKDSYIVATMMTRLVKSMYERDFQSAIAHDLEEEREMLRVSRKEYHDRKRL